MGTLQDASLVLHRSDDRSRHVVDDRTNHKVDDRSRHVIDDSINDIADHRAETVCCALGNEGEDSF